MGIYWWRVDGAPTATEWSALFAGLTLAVAIAAALVALGQHRAHLRAERARARPYVIVDYSFRSILMQVEIKNIGTSAASDVHLSVDPPFESGLQDQAERLNSVFSPAESIAMLAPGRRILYTFDRAPDYLTAQRPERYTITARYRDLSSLSERKWWAPWLKRPVTYTDEYPLDFRQWSQASAETDYDEKNWNIANRGEQREKEMVRALKSIAESASHESERITTDYVLDVVQEGDLAREYTIEHPGIEPSREEAPARTAPAKRANRKSGRPRFRWTRNRR